MTEPSPNPQGQPTESYAAQNALILAGRADTVALCCFYAGVLLMLIGLVLALSRGRGGVCLFFGGLIFLTGCAENVRAEILRVRAKLEKD